MFVSKGAYQEAIQRLLDHNEAQDNLIQAKDAQIAALTQDRDNWRSRALEDAWPPEWIVASELHELLQAKDAQHELLQAKDAQIEALVTALRMAEWSGVAQWGISPRCPKCFVRRGKEHRIDCEIGNAIKEATNG